MSELFAVFIGFTGVMYFFLMMYLMDINSNLKKILKKIEDWIYYDTNGRLK